jgi:hypothetical protein
MLPLLDPLDRVASLSDTFPLMRKLISVATLPTTVSCEEGFSVMNMVKPALGHHCRQAALMIQC